MTIKKVGDKWKVEVRPGGAHGPRFRKQFSTKAEATAFEAHVTEKYRTRKDWEPTRDDNRRLSELAQQWHDLHGYNLRDGEGRLQILKALCTRLNNPLARLLTPADFIQYGNDRIRIPTERNKKGANPETVNRELSYLKAVYNKLIKLGDWSGPNPIEHVPRWRTEDRELTYLTLEQIDRLLPACEAGNNPDTRLCAELSLDTGARWSEAEGIKVGQIGQQRVTYYNTKGGKPRTVPITGELEKRLRDYYQARGQEDGRLFGPCYDSFLASLRRAKITLPAGQKAHVLRHTFASHFMMNGGNILVLKNILGHYSVQQTEKYAHLAPDYLADAVRFGPRGSSTG